MITEKVIERLLDLLDESVSKFRTHTTPDQQWLSEVNWLVHDLRRDLDLKHFEFDGLAPYSELKALKDQVDKLEKDNYRLENALDEAPSQDDVNELNDEIRDLNKELQERDDRIAELEDDNGRMVDYVEDLEARVKEKEDKDVHV